MAVLKRTLIHSSPSSIHRSLVGGSEDIVGRVDATESPKVYQKKNTHTHIYSLAMVVCLMAAYKYFGGTTTLQLAQHP